VEKYLVPSDLSIQGYKWTGLQGSSWFLELQQVYVLLSSFPSLLMSCGCFFITWTIEIWIKNAAQHNPGLKFWRRCTLCISVFILPGVVTVWGVTHSGTSLVPPEFKGYYFVMWKPSALCSSVNGVGLICHNRTSERPGILEIEILAFARVSLFEVLGVIFLLWYPEGTQLVSWL